MISKNNKSRKSSTIGALPQNLTVKQLEALLRKEKRKQRVLTKNNKKKTVKKKVTKVKKDNKVSSFGLLGLLIPLLFVSILVVLGAK